MSDTEDITTKPITSLDKKTTFESSDDSVGIRQRSNLGKEKQAYEYKERNDFHDDDEDDDKDFVDVSKLKSSAPPSIMTPQRGRIFQQHLNDQNRRKGSSNTTTRTGSNPGKKTFIERIFGSNRVFIFVILAAAAVYFYGPFGGKKPFGKVLRLNVELMDKIIAPNTSIETLTSGLSWTEGPLYLPHKRVLLFSDVKKNVMFQWSENKSAKQFVRPSGLEGKNDLLEPGSNGLVLGPNDLLIYACDHGNRRVYRLESDNTTKTPIATHYKGRRLNSPNDAVFDSNGDLLFTDPSYGMRRKGRNVEPEDSPERELTFNGVFRIRATHLERTLTETELLAGEHLELLTDSIPRPNGIAFTPDFKRLIVSNSNGSDPSWFIFDVLENGTLENGKLFAKAHDFKEQQQAWFKSNSLQLIGNADGLKIDHVGNIFATAPGGVMVFQADGTHIGTIATGVKTGNCEIGEDGYLYICADTRVVRIKTLTKPNVRRTLRNL